MSEKKKKQSPNTGVNALIFILFWVISLGFLELSFWNIWSDIYNFVAINLPAIFHRLWIAYLIDGLIIGLGFGLAQKVAIQALSSLHLKYWVRTSIFFAVLAQFLNYMALRFVDWKGFVNTEIYFLAIAIGYQVLLTMAQWLILRKHFKQASLWLLMLIPIILNFVFNYSPNYLPTFIVSQALISALALLWMHRQSLPTEKAKNTEEAEARLSDTLPEEDELQGGIGRYQTSEA
jgi:hypothetical protein